MYISVSIRVFPNRIVKEYMTFMFIEKKNGKVNLYK